MYFIVCHTVASCCAVDAFIDNTKLGQGLVTSRTLEKEDYPQSLIDLYERNTEARQFVLDYKTKKDDNAAIDVSADVNAGEIPLFLQWDERWGYRSYGGDFLAVTGCGPTALSMVYVGLTGDTSMNPYEVAKRAEKEGYYVKGSGSEWSMMTGLASELGLSAKELGLDADLIRKSWKKGIRLSVLWDREILQRPVIISC